MAEYEFHSTDAMRGIANDPSKIPEVAEKALYTAAEDGEVATWDGDALTEMDGHKVVFNPMNGTIYDVVTDEYVPIQPTDFLDPLIEELNDRDRDVHGSFNTFNGGARGYLEAVLTDSGIWPKDRSEHQEPVRSGVTVSWSHDSGVSVKARGFAQDGMCENTMRDVSDPVYVKHAGDVEARIDWPDEWAGILNQLGAFSESLERVIDSAFDHVVWDLSANPFSDEWRDATDGLQKLNELQMDLFTEAHRDGINGFFDLLGFPAYLCYHATSRTLWRLTQKEQNVSQVTAWDLYSGATYALTHQAQFESGSPSDEDYHRAASEILMNPDLAEQEAQQELQQRLHADAAEDEPLGIEASAGDAMREYKERSTALRSAFDAE